MFDEQVFLPGPPLVVGRTREIHPHPGRADRLVKVLRPEFVEKQYGPLTRRYKLWRRTGRFQCYLREIREYLAYHARFPAEQCPVVPVTGLVATNLGLGMVVPKIGDGRGGLAPTLAALVKREGFTPRLRALFDEFHTLLLERDVVIHDLNPENFLLVDGNGDGEEGSARLVLADGFGDRHVIPICSMWPAWNRFQIRKRFARLLERLQAMPTP